MQDTCVIQWKSYISVDWTTTLKKEWYVPSKLYCEKRKENGNHDKCYIAIKHGEEDKI